MPRSTYTTREPWTEGVNRLADTIYQIINIKNQQKLQEQQAQRQALQDQMLQEQLNQFRRKASLEEEMRTNVPQFTMPMQVENPLFKERGVPYAPTVIKQVPRPQEELLPEIQQYVAKYGSPAEVLKFMQSQTKSPELPYKMGQIVKDIAKEGKLYQGTFAGLNPDGTPRFVNMQEQVESFKAPSPVGRGGVSGRVILRNPNTGELYYEDSYKTGKIEGVSAEDSANPRPLTVRGISPEQTSELAGMKTTFENLTDVYSRAKGMKGKFGPLAGRWTTLKQKFMADGTTQEVVNELRSLITIAYGLSGKQISIQELQMLQDAILPNMNQPFENFAATLRFARDWVGRTHDNRIDYFKSAYFDVGIPYLVRGKKKDELSLSEPAFKITNDGEDPLGWRK